MISFRPGKRLLRAGEWCILAAQQCGDRQKSAESRSQRATNRGSQAHALFREQVMAHLPEPGVAPALTPSFPCYGKEKCTLIRR
jgi:hypothetical protein